ncbi:conserved uncharacterized protein (C-terminal fragment), partial [Ustilago hordei]
THLGLAADTTAVFSHEVLRRHRKKNIWFLEALAILEALRLFAPLWSSPLTVVVHVDNENVEHGLHSGSSHDPLTQKLLWEIFGFCFTHNFTLHPMHVSTTDNVLADLLSHRQFHHIQQSFPQAYSQLSFCQGHVDQPANPLPPSHPAWGSLRQWLPCSGTALRPALETVLVVLSPLSKPSAPGTWVPTSLVCLPLVSSSSSGLAACPPPAVHTTPPSTSSATSAPTTSTLASAWPALSAAISSRLCVATSASMALGTPAPSSPSRCPSFAALSLLSIPSATSLCAIAPCSRRCSPSPLPVSCTRVRSSGTGTPTQPSSFTLAASNWPPTMPSSPCRHPRWTPSTLASRSSPLLSAAQNAQSPTFATCSLVVPLLPPSLASAHLGQTPSHTRRSLPSFSTPLPSPAWHSRPMLAIPFDAVPPRGRPALAPAPRPSSASAVGILTVSGATLTAPPANAMTSPSLPSSVFVTAPSSPTAPRGKTWGPPSPSLGPALSRVLSAAQVPRLSVGRPGASEPARFAADPQSNPFSHLSAV